MEKESGKVILTNDFDLHIIELSKLMRLKKKELENKLVQWMLFLDNPNSMEVKEIMDKNEDIKEAVDTLDKISQDRKMARIAELREKAIRDEKNLIRTYSERGFEQGIEQNKLDTAKKMLEFDIPIDTIQKVTGLSKEKIESL